MSKFYDGLPFPFSSLPLPGEPVTVGTIGDVVVPLLQTLHFMLDTLIDAAQHEVMQSQHYGAALMALNASLGFSIELIERLVNGETA